MAIRRYPVGPFFIKRRARVEFLTRDKIQITTSLFSKVFLLVDGKKDSDAGLTRVVNLVDLKDLEINVIRDAKASTGKEIFSFVALMHRAKNSDNGNNNNKKEVVVSVYARKSSDN